MKALITGSGGLIGSSAAIYFIEQGFEVVGIDNNMRKEFFGQESSVSSHIDFLIDKLRPKFNCYKSDIRNKEELEKIFESTKFDLIIHTAAQPSHDWASRDVLTDFDINARATILLLEMTKQYCPDSVFIYMSTNKVYGDTPNKIDLFEYDTRYDIPGYTINEEMPIDNSTHSFFGCSKSAGDLYVQEYGKYYGMKTCVFRGGCLTGENHKGAELHGFLSYLVKCAMIDKEYIIYGYKGKQVRDNIYAYDVCTAFHEVYKNPVKGEVFNLGGGTYSNCSIIEAIDIIEKLSGKKLRYKYVDKPRKGDHIWYISNLAKFKTYYPNWKHTYNIEQIIQQIINSYD